MGVAFIFFSVILSTCNEVTNRIQDAVPNSKDILEHCIAKIKNIVNICIFPDVILVADVKKSTDFF